MIAFLAMKLYYLRVVRICSFRIPASRNIQPNALQRSLQPNVITYLCFMNQKLAIHNDSTCLMLLINTGSHTSIPD